MIWIVIAIIVAGYLIGEAIKKSSASKIAYDTSVKQAELIQRDKELAQKQKVEQENSPLYQKHVNASLEYMDYSEQYNLSALAKVTHELQLIKRPDMSASEKRKHQAGIKDAGAKMKALQNEYFNKWDKIERQIDPRRALLVSNEAVRVRFDIWEKDQELLKKYMSELHSLERASKATTK